MVSICVEGVSIVVISVISPIDCQYDGTNLPPFTVTNHNSAKKNPVESIIKRDELVKEK